jgi:hypothetical protein
VSEAPLLAEVVPELAQRLEWTLREQGEPHLAAQVPALRVTEACRCGEPSCGSFWTSPTPMRRWFSRGRQIELLGLPGEVALDVVAGRIAYVEVLHWDEVRAAITNVSLAG